MEIDNAERRRRHAEYNLARVVPERSDAQKLAGEHGPQAGGKELAKIQANENLRAELERALKSLQGISDRSILNRNSRDAYEQHHAYIHKLAKQYWTVTGRSTVIPGLVPDRMLGKDIVINGDWLTA
jgi:hypothetical protein